MRVLIYMCIAISVIIAGCDTKQSQVNDNQNGEMVAQVGEINISIEQLRSEVKSRPGGERRANHPGAYQTTLNQMIDLFVAEIEAQAQGIKDSDEYTQGLELIKARAAREERELVRKLLLKKISTNVGLAEEELQAYYQQVKNRFLTNRLQLRRIVVDDEESAKTASKRISAGESFTNVAVEINTDPELRKTKGEMGSKLRNEIPRELRVAAFSLKKENEVSEPFMAYGKWNLFQLVKRETGVIRPLDNVRTQLEQELKRKKSASLFEQILAKRKTELEVKINNSNLAKLGPMTSVNRKSVNLGKLSRTNQNVAPVQVAPIDQGH